ncbi:MAG: DNA-binding transcriptional regulator Fis [Haliea sp.]|jgi:Fis family transcriptional regulator|nr:DNA-binding transcriptional regulator Fis [Haliea sp.]MBK6736390.1 DNA-binding transcriptional regulator Fis [Haliea sp.]
MIRAESLHASTTELTAANDVAIPAVPATRNLRDAVTTAVRNYLEELDGQLSSDVYQMVLAEVEAPLLAEIMAYTRNNQTRASIMLGLNRGTLRKKLKQYKLISERD